MTCLQSHQTSENSADHGGEVEALALGSTRDRDRAGPGGGHRGGRGSRLRSRRRSRSRLRGGLRSRLRLRSGLRLRRRPGRSRGLGGDRGSRRRRRRNGKLGRLGRLAGEARLWDWKSVTVIKAA